MFSGARKSIEKLKYTCEMRYFGKNSVSGKKIYWLKNMHEFDNLIIFLNILN